jgi:hypothetical protein
MQTLYYSTARSVETANSPVAAGVTVTVGVGTLRGEGVSTTAPAAPTAGVTVTAKPLRPPESAPAPGLPSDRGSRPGVSGFTTGSAGNPTPRGDALPPPSAFDPPAPSPAPPAPSSSGGASLLLRCLSPSSAEPCGTVRAEACGSSE